MSGKIRHLLFRRGRYYARMAVPSALRSIIGKRELTEALDADRRIAERLLAAVTARMQRQIDAARVQTDEAPQRRTVPIRGRQLQQRQLALAHYETELEIDDATRNSGQYTPFGQPFADVYRNKLKLLAAGLLADDEIGALIGWALTGFMDRGNLNVERGSPEWRSMARTLASVQLEALQRLQERDQGDFTGSPTLPILKSKASPTPDSSNPLAIRILGPESHKTLSELLPEYLRQKDMSEASKNEAHVAVRMAEDWFVETRPVYTYTRRDMLQFMDALVGAPSNALKRFPGLTLPQAIEANKKRKVPYPALDLRTVDKWLSCLRTMFKWLMRRDILPDNPLADVKTERKKTATEPSRLDFGTADLGKIFSPQNGFDRSSDWGEFEWATLVSLFTGIRPSELAQVTLDNISLDSGILVMRVQGKLKTRSSWRMIPIHSKLIELGFERRIEGLRKLGKRHLFPDWYANGCASLTRAEIRAKATGMPISRNNFFPKYIPTKFNRNLRKLGITDTRLDFYSLRHTFRTKLINAGVVKDICDRLTGHSDHSPSKSYDHSEGKEEKSLIEMLKGGIEKLRFDGISL